MRHLLCLALSVSFCSAFVGCTQGVPEEVITVSAANDPFHEPRSILERYKQTGAIGSEISTIGIHIAKVKEVDPAKADILTAGFADIQKASTPAARKKIASELLGKIAPASGGPSAE